MAVTDTLNPIEFNRRQIAVSFLVFRRDGTQETIDINGDYRIRATISNAGFNGTGGSREVNLVIEGIPFDLMNRLSFISSYSSDDGQNIIDCSRSMVTVQAGVKGNALAAVFNGNISEAYADYSAAPEVTFRVKANDFNILSHDAGEPLNYRTPVHPVTILSDICAHNGITLYDHGGWGPKAEVMFNYLSGTPLSQIQQVVDSVHAQSQLDLNGSINAEKRFTATLPILHVWGQYARRGEDVAQESIPIISAENGMIGYPRYSPVGCRILSIFRPELTYYSLVNLKSRYLPAAWQDTDEQGYNQFNQLIHPDASKTPWDGYWLINSVNHDLSCEVPGGPWLTEVECVISDYPHYILSK